MNTVASSHSLVVEPALEGELIGILAGWGRFPIATAEAIHRRGGRVAILTIRHHAEESLEPLADVYGEVGVAEIDLGEGDVGPAGREIAGSVFSCFVASLAMAWLLGGIQGWLAA